MIRNNQKTYSRLTTISIFCMAYVITVDDWLFHTLMVLVGLVLGITLVFEGLFDMIEMFRELKEDKTE